MSTVSALALRETLLRSRLILLDIRGSKLTYQHCPSVHAKSQMENIFVFYSLTSILVAQQYQRVFV